MCALSHSGHTLRWGTLYMCALSHSGHTLRWGTLYMCALSHSGHTLRWGTLYMCALSHSGHTLRWGSAWVQAYDHAGVGTGLGLGLGLGLRFRIRLRRRTKLGLRGTGLGFRRGGRGGSVPVAKPDSVHRTFLELQLLIIPQHHIHIPPNPVWLGLRIRMGLVPLEWPRTALHPSLSTVTVQVRSRVAASI